MGLGVVEEFRHERMVFQGLLNDAPLHAATAPMYQTNAAKTCVVCIEYVLFSDGWNVSRCERMQVQRVRDGNPNGLVIPHFVIRQRTFMSVAFGSGQ